MNIKIYNINLLFDWYDLKLVTEPVNLSGKCLWRSQTKGRLGPFFYRLNAAEVVWQPEESPPAGYQKECKFKAAPATSISWHHAEPRIEKTVYSQSF